MKFQPLYPEDDKATLNIEKENENSVKFIFDILENFRGKLWITFSTTIWWVHSWGQKLSNNIKKHLNQTIDLVKNSNNLIYKDSEKFLKIHRSSWSDDISICYRLNKPEHLKNKYEIKLNEKNIKQEVLHELLALFQ